MNELSPQEEFSNSLPPVWKEKLSGVEGESFFKDLTRFLKAEYQASKTIYPSRENVMRALKELDLPSVKVVILGQDPYHGADQAIGFSFAVPNHLFPKPPSLVNIFKELESDLQVKISRENSDLTGWVEQGVLLLNTVLTVEASKPLSHRDRGWEKFTEPGDRSPRVPSGSTGFHFMGESRPEDEGEDRSEYSQGNRNASPVSLVRLSRILWLESLLPGE